MSLLKVEANEKQKTKVNLFRFALFLTFVYKMWFMAELQSSAITLDLGNGVLVKVLVYLISAVSAFFLSWLATSLTYGMIAKSKYCPINEFGDFVINKPTYTIIVSVAIMISNLIGGSLNFIAYSIPVSILFFVLIMPVLLSVLSIALIVFLMSFECKKGDFCRLFVSMALPSIIFIILLR